MDFLTLGIDIVPVSDLQLKIMNHYAWWYGLLAFAVFGLPALRAVGQAIKTERWLPITWAVLFAVMCYMAASLFSTGVVTFDKTTKTVTYDKTGFLFVTHRFQYALDAVQYAVMKEETLEQRLTIVLDNGHAIRLSAYASQGEPSRAAEAINQFLQLRPPG